MIGDIRPGNRPSGHPTAQSKLTPVNNPIPDPKPPLDPSTQSTEQIFPEKPRNKRKKWLIALIIGIFLALLLSAAGAYAWYELEIGPVNTGDTTLSRVEIAEGTSTTQLSSLLEQKNLIRSSLAFEIYARLSGTGGKLQAGTYSLSPSQSVGEIVSHLTSGKVDHYSITFLPGALLDDKSGTPLGKRTDVASVLLKAGYSQAEIDRAFSSRYDSPLLADKPADASLEGYVYGETYDIYSSSTVQQILQKTFDEYYAQLTKNGLIDAFKAENLSLFQGITLASIVQREITNPTDQPKVAQIFLSRLKIGMPLGSDVTYQYAAAKLGVAATPDLDSPYNTRKVVGLPPGPIASPGLSALLAVAHPASTDYLYFLSGDDGITYFAHTEDEHNANIAAHCRVKCR